MRVFVLAWLAACGSKGAPVAAAAPRVHPLVGRIWSTAGARFGTEEELLADLRSAEFVLLGENHDNAEHHRLQARMITAIAPASVAFEMLDHADPVDAPDAESLALAVGWEDSGWPAFSLYAPVFDAVYAVPAQIVAGHPTRDEVRAVMSGGLEALPPEATAGLAIERELSEAEQDALVAELFAAHPGHASPELVDQMVRAQVLKDRWMARALSSSPRPAVLIAGGGHTRRDRGVPIYLQGTVRTVRLVEALPGETDPAACDEGADWCWFTVQAEETE